MDQVWWYTFVILVLRKLRQEVHEFEASLSYIARLFNNISIEPTWKAETRLQDICDLGDFP